MINVILRRAALKNLVVGMRSYMNSENEILRFTQDDKWGNVILRRSRV
jgi:hypothetical protein